jgi:hypothetical protein
MINFKIKLFTLIILSSHSYVNADDKIINLAEAIENIMVPNSTIVDKSIENIMPSEKMITKNPLKGVGFDLTKIVNISDKVIGISDSIFKQGPILPEESGLILKPGEYIQIRGDDRRLLLFNGSFIVHFKVLPDLEGYAVANQLEYVTSLSDINMGVFKVSNLIDLESKLNSLQGDNNIISIDLDTIDPSIKPR